MGLILTASCWLVRLQPIAGLWTPRNLSSCRLFESIQPVATDSIARAGETFERKCRPESSTLVSSQSLNLPANNTLLLGPTFATAEAIEGVGPNAIV